MNARGETRTEPLLSDILELLIPTEDETWFLRACLHEGQAGRSAYQIWNERVGDPKEIWAGDGQGRGQLLPLLYRALRDGGGVADRSVLPYLRTAYFREELRSQVFRDVCRDALVTLTAEKVPFVVVRGVALAETVYGDWALRHCSDVDLLIHQEAQAAAVSALRQRGYRMHTQAAGNTGREAAVVHTSGLPIRFHSELFSIPYYRLPMAKMWARTVVREIATAPVQVQAAEDLLLHVCGHAACSGSRASLRWVCDAWYVMKRSPNLNWAGLLDNAIQARLALPLWVMFRYLSEELGAPVPVDVLEALAAEAAEADVVGMEAALEGVRIGARGSTRTIRRHARSWRSRAVVYKWLLLPSCASLRWRYPAYPCWRLALHYIRTPLRYLGWRVLALVRRLRMGA